jgi:Starch-binding associating with outer membrane
MKKIFILLIVGISSLSCTNYIDEAFKNPNAPTEVTPAEALPPMFSNMAGAIQFDARVLGRYTQYWTLTASGSSWDRQGYDPNSDTGGEKWRMHYFTLGQNVVNMIRDARKENKPEYIGAGYAIFAWSWLNLTDYHGDVILKQAFDTGRLTFDYDSQEEVYKHVAAMCDSADVYLKNASNKQISADFINADRWFYGGDMKKWQKFVNGVRAKLAHRYSLKSNYKPDEVIRNVDASITTLDDEAMVQFNNGPSSTADANFFGPRRNNMGSYRPTDFFIRLLDGTVYGGVRDPRLAYIFKPSDDGIFRGLVVNSGEATTLPTNRKTYNPFGYISTAAMAGDLGTTARTYFKSDAKFPLMTLSELQFIKSEAAFLKGDKVMALSAFQAGIRANFDMFTKNYTGYKNFTPAEVTNYINAVSPKSPSDLTLSNILLQKYIALWGYGFEETWVDLRRYQYSPDIYPTWRLPTFYPDNFGKNVYRVRPRYNSEYLWNVEALRKIKGLEVDYHTIPTFFAEKK